MKVNGKSTLTYANQAIPSPYLMPTYEKLVNTINSIEVIDSEAILKAIVDMTKSCE